MRMLIEGFERPVLIQWERVMSEAEYSQLCVDNPDLRIERTAEGNIIVRRNATTSQAPS
ncbi:MAG: hypothetical protein ABSF54_00995 [Bryobacteraceae bacterium]|jgi:hypothetical protein